MNAIPAYERVLFTEDRPALTRIRRIRVVLVAGIVGVGLPTVMGLGVLAFVWWRQAAALTALAAAVVIVVPMRVRKRVVPGQIDLSLHVAGVRVAARRIRAGDITACRWVPPPSRQYVWHVWHAPLVGPAVVDFSGEGVSLILRGHSELVIGSADSRRLLAAVQACSSEPPG